MASAQYDEDLTKNPLYLELKDVHGEVLKEAILNQWIICLPRTPTLTLHKQDDCFDPHFVMRHILVASDDLPETHFRALDDRQVSIG